MSHTSKYINENRNLDIFVSDIVIDILAMRKHIGEPESDFAQEETLPCIEWKMTFQLTFTMAV